MVDCGLNPELCMAMARLRQPLKGAFYTQKFLYQNFALLAILLKHLLFANCVIVDQAVVQLNYGAYLSWASYDFLVQSRCFVIISHSKRT